ncbi:MAG: ankyrin repeat domain-containing protein [Synergistaceae bacterium]|nr:ankyrin repeat domain-containing protein [Synergistaceae bacterium]
MENVIEWLREARGEIIAGLVLALLGWLYSRYRSFMKMYRLKKKELERMENDMFRFGNTKKEIESLQEALKESEAQRQDVKNQIETLQQELQRKDEALRESEAKSHEASQRIEALQSQLETSQAELQHRDEALKESEAQRLDVKNQLFVYLCEAGNTGKVEAALINGANVNAKDNYGRTVLMWAAINGHTETAELLLKHGADVNAENNYGRTALMWAAVNGKTETAELLLKHGADVNAKDNYGWTALRLATNIETADLLRRYGARE